MKRAGVENREPTRCLMVEYFCAVGGRRLGCDATADVTVVDVVRLVKMLGLLFCAFVHPLKTSNAH